MSGNASRQEPVCEGKLEIKLGGCIEHLPTPVCTQNFGHTVEQEGDSFSIVFEDPGDAVKFCLQVWIDRVHVVLRYMDGRPCFYLGFRI